MHVRRDGDRDGVGMSVRGKIAFPRLYRHADGRTMSEARSVSTATMVPEIFTRHGYERGKSGGGGEGDEKKED